jgi:[glutamine synthetase] adenylyltransferase / [glutamine synthetase]-adenylyl-L-tyrosine phosphorylase
MPPSPATSLSDAIDRAERWSPYLRKLLRRFPDVAANPAAFLAPVPDEARPVAEALRLAKAQLAQGTALCDLSGALPLAGVTRALSDFADLALDRAISDAVTSHVPGAEPRGFAAIALGKHGGRELNYSSDIDPIFLYDPASLPRRTREEVEEAAVRIGRKVLETMQARTEHGYVFRVDLRLRPSPEVTPRFHTMNRARCPGSGRRSSERARRRGMLRWARPFWMRSGPSSGGVRLILVRAERCAR